MFTLTTLELANYALVKLKLTLGVMAGHGALALKISGSFCFCIAKRFCCKRHFSRTAAFEFLGKVCPCILLSCVPLSLSPELTPFHSSSPVCYWISAKQCFDVDSQSGIGCWRMLRLHHTFKTRICRVLFSSLDQ